MHVGGVHDVLRGFVLSREPGNDDLRSSNVLREHRILVYANVAFINGQFEIGSVHQYVWQDGKSSFLQLFIIE
jgi:hypothetical protein